MIILHGNILHKQIRKQKTIHGTTQQQFMVSGVGDLTFTGLVFSWFFSTGRRKDQGLELQLHAVQKLWPSYCTSSGVRITIPK